MSFAKVLHFVLFVGISIFLSKNAYSQTFCPPGATWYYSYVGAWFDGYEKHTYSHDTVINSVNCKEITRYIEGSSPFGQQSGYYSSYYTYEQGGVVALYNNSFGNNHFDTLYNINAQVGDKWRLPMVDTACVDSSYFVQVQNIGTKMINGFNLKWWYVKIGPIQSYDNNFYYMNDTIFERLSYKFENISSASVVYCNNISNEGSGGFLRCYSDSTFGYFSTGIVDSCNYYYTGLLELDKSQRNIRVFPNPTNDYVNVKVGIKENKQGNFILYDMTGKMLMCERIENSNSINTFNISSINAGIYFYKVNIDNKYFTTEKLIITK